MRLFLHGFVWAHFYQADGREEAAADILFVSEVNGLIWCRIDEAREGRNTNCFCLQGADIILTSFKN